MCIRDRFGIVSFAWAGFGAAFGPLVICSLFWKRTTLPGAIAGMVSGGAMVFILSLIHISQRQGISALAEFECERRNAECLYRPVLEPRV